MTQRVLYPCNHFLQQPLKKTPNHNRSKTYTLLDMSDKITELDSSNFDSTISGASVPVVVDFWAPWCGPCKAIAPILEELADELGDSAQICKVNVDNNSEVAGKYEIRAIPTILVFKNGEVAETIVGLTSKDDLKAKLV